LDGEKTNQPCFSKNLFHLPEVVAAVDVAREKNLFPTCFTQRKLVLWKRCGFTLGLFLNIVFVTHNLGLMREYILASSP
jgi:hypothetical protein